LSAKRVQTRYVPAYSERGGRYNPHPVLTSTKPASTKKLLFEQTISSEGYFIFQSDGNSRLTSLSCSEKESKAEKHRPFCTTLTKKQKLATGVVALRWALVCCLCFWPLGRTGRGRPMYTVCLPRCWKEAAAHYPAGHMKRRCAQQKIRTFPCVQGFVDLREGVGQIVRKGGLFAPLVVF